MIRASVRRSNTLKGRWAYAEKQVAVRVEKAMLATGESLLERSKPFVPKDTLALLDSGIVRQIGSLFTTQIIVGYGGINFPPRTEYSMKEGTVVTREPYKYAVYVHEDITQRHDTGQYEYLAVPLRTEREELRLVFIAALR